MASLQVIPDPRGEIAVEDRRGETAVAPDRPGPRGESALSLWNLHERYLALLESVPTPEQQTEYDAELTVTRGQLVAKVDGVCHFMAHCESQMELATVEIQRLQRRKAACERALEWMEGTVIRIIRRMGKDAKKRWPKLEGATTSLTLHGCVQAVEVTDEQAVPAKFKRAMVTLPADLWEQLVDALPLDLAAQVLEAVRAPKLEVSLSAAKIALDAKEDVPGCKLGGGVYVVRK